MKPTPLQNIDFSAVIEMCKDEIDEIAAGEHNEDNDNIGFIYEEVMQAVFGKDIFLWISNHI